MCVNIVISLFYLTGITSFKVYVNGNKIGINLITVGVAHSYSARFWLVVYFKILPSWYALFLCR